MYIICMLEGRKIEIALEFTGGEKKREKEREDDNGASSII